MDRFEANLGVVRVGTEELSQIGWDRLFIRHGDKVASGWQFDRANEWILRTDGTARKVVNIRAADGSRPILGHI